MTGRKIAGMMMSIMMIFGDINNGDDGNGECDKDAVLTSASQ